MSIKKLLLWRRTNVDCIVRGNCILMPRIRSNSIVDSLTIDWNQPDRKYIQVRVEGPQKVSSEFIWLLNHTREEMDVESGNLTKHISLSLSLSQLFSMMTFLESIYLLFIIIIKLGPERVRKYFSLCPWFTVNVIDYVITRSYGQNYFFFAIFYVWLWLL